MKFTKQQIAHLGLFPSWIEAKESRLEREIASLEVLEEQLIKWVA